MPSSTQVVATQVVFDYLLDSTGAGIPNKTFRVALNYPNATSIAPLTTLSQTVVSGTTDANGYWQVSLVPNTNISPANTTYTVQTPWSTSYDITVGAAGPYQSTAVGTLVNAPAALTPATSNLTGPLTVAGLLTAQAGLVVTGGTTTDTLTISSGGLSVPGPLTLTQPASRVIPGATSFSVRDTANANDNLLVSNAGVVTARAGLVATAGGLTVSAGGAAITGASTITGSLHVTTTSALDGDVTAGARLVFSTAVSKLVPGATSLQLRNNADSATNLQLSDAGLATLRNALSVPPVAGGTVATSNYGTMPIKSEEQTVSGSVAATITLPASGSFPTGFRHMKIRVRARGDAGVAIVNMGIRFNADNGANYDGQVITANGTGANPTNVNATATTPPICSDAPGNTATANDWSDVIIEIRDYNAAIRQCAHIRSIVHDIDSNAGTFFRVGIQTWRTAAALTSIVLALSSGNFAIGTEVTTYLEP